MDNYPKDSNSVNCEATDEVIVDYIRSCGEGYSFFSPVIITQQVKKLKEEIQSNTTILLNGPKGCGKSFTITLLYIMLQRDNKCLYISSNTFYDECIGASKSYLEKLVETLHENSAKQSDISHERKCLWWFYDCDQRVT